MSYSAAGGYSMGGYGTGAYGTGGSGIGSGSATISITESGNVVSGTVSGQVGTAQISGGTPNGEQVSNVRVLFTPQSTSMGFGSVGGSPMGTQCSYTGSLTYSGGGTTNQIQAQLISATAQGAMGAGMMGTTCGMLSFSGRHQ